MISTWNLHSRLIERGAYILLWWYWNLILSGVLNICFSPHFWLQSINSDLSFHRVMMQLLTYIFLNNGAAQIQQAAKPEPSKHATEPGSAVSERTHPELDHRPWRWWRTVWRQGRQYHGDLGLKQGVWLPGTTKTQSGWKGKTARRRSGISQRLPSKASAGFTAGK